MTAHLRGEAPSAPHKRLWSSEAPGHHRLWFALCPAREAQSHSFSFPRNFPEAVEAFGARKGREVDGAEQEGH